MVGSHDFAFLFWFGDSFVFTSDGAREHDWQDPGPEMWPSMLEIPLF